MTLFWIIVAIIVIGVAIWYLVAGKKKKPGMPEKPPEGPIAPPPSPPTPPSPPEGPLM